VLTSLRLDLGVVSVVSKTQIGDSCFAGNGNHVNEGLPARTHLGLHTLLSKKPESAGGFFGNPPMRFPSPALHGDSAGCGSRVKRLFCSDILTLLFIPSLRLASSSFRCWCAGPLGHSTT